MMTRFPGEYSHIEPLLAQMSEARRKEMVSLSEQLNASPADMLCSSLDNSSETFTYFADGDPIAMGGVAKTPVGGFCWMIASTERVEQHKKYFLQESHSRIDHWSEVYGDLFVDVAVEEVKSIRWLEWLGFHRTGKMAHLLGRDVCRLERRS